MPQPDHNAVLEAMYLIIREVLRLPDEQELKPETRLVEDLGANSIDHFDILTRLEEKFPVDFVDFEYRDGQTLGDVADFICRCIQPRGGDES
ncbi:MAG: phosphopantetheine-binding protein [Patescibacteria group bacterium]